MVCGGVLWCPRMDPCISYRCISLSYRRVQLAGVRILIFGSRSACYSIAEVACECNVPVEVACPEASRFALIQPEPFGVPWSPNPGCRSRAKIMPHGNFTCALQQLLKLSAYLRLAYALILMISLRMLNNAIGQPCIYTVRLRSRSALAPGRLN
jgi:hypothetical protein